ncbi:MAG TPA: hypothetical protein VMV77_15075 [Bacteroidales bacterium]|nr:hypothetical protein [Bacteroidales bacterium]
MYLKHSITSIFILLLIIETSFSQSLSYPNYALKSHETLEITKVEINSDETIVYLTIENRIEGGKFCADRNIYLIEPDGAKLKLINSSGIPVCPDTYKFKAIGEKLGFILTFPPLKEGTECVDLIEDCSENCFSFYEVTLDSNLNRKIDDAFILVENDQPVNALVSFIIIAEEADRNNQDVGGLVYLNIIKLAQETGNTLKATEWYSRLKSSGIPGLELYFKNLNTQGIKY